MHDVRVAEQIIAAARPFGTVKRVVVAVGELSGMEPEELRETLQTMTSWQVETRVVAGNIRCACGFTGAPEILEQGHDYCLFRCPDCKKKPEVVAGGEIMLVGVD